MNEDSLKHLSLAQLFDRMVKSVNELLVMHKNYGKFVIMKKKQKEVELLQMAILTKRAENVPGRHTTF